MTRRQTLKYLLAAGAALIIPGYSARPAKAATDVFLKIKSFKFNPRQVEVKVGDTLIIENLDGARHTATAVDGSWNTGTLRKGKSAEIEIVAGMHTDYFCKFHRNMKGSLKIVG